MTAYKDALTQLIVGDQIVVGGEVKHRDPLIHILRESMYPSGGKGSSSGGGDSSVLNTAAMDLYDHIDGFARSCLTDWHRSPHGELALVLERMFDAIQAEQAAWMTPDDADRYYARFPEWVMKITDLLDPPHVLELSGSCPQCEVTHHVVGDVVNIALVASAKLGRAPMVECRACKAVWVHRDDLTGLAEHLGAVIDWGAVFGVDSGL